MLHIFKLWDHAKSSIGWALLQWQRDLITLQKFFFLFSTHKIWILARNLDLLHPSEIIIYDSMNLYQKELQVGNSNNFKISTLRGGKITTENKNNKELRTMTSLRKEFKERLNAIKMSSIKLAYLFEGKNLERIKTTYCIFFSHDIQFKFLTKSHGCTSSWYLFLPLFSFHSSFSYRSSGF